MDPGFRRDGAELRFFEFPEGMEPVIRVRHTPKPSDWHDSRIQLW